MRGSRCRRFTISLGVPNADRRPHPHLSPVTRRRRVAVWRSGVMSRRTLPASRTPTIMAAVTPTTSHVLCSLLSCFSPRKSRACRPMIDRLEMHGSYVETKRVAGHQNRPCAASVSPASTSTNVESFAVDLRRPHPDNISLGDADLGFEPDMAAFLRQLDNLREWVLPAHGCSGPLSWHCREMTSRSIRMPPGPSIRISAGRCLKTVHAKSIAAAGTAKAAGD